MRFAFDFVDPGDNRVERMGARIGQRRLQTWMSRKPLQIALGGKNGAGFAAVDPVQQFGRAGPFGGDAFARLRVGPPISFGRPGKIEKRVEPPRMFESGHPASKRRQGLQVDRQPMPCDHLSEVGSAE